MKRLLANSRRKSDKASVDFTPLKNYGAVDNGVSSGKKNDEEEFALRQSESLYMNGSQNPIDFVLAYRPSAVGGMKATLHPQYRIQFEKRLKQQGLLMEYEGIEKSQDGKTCFVKLHAPWEVLTRIAEINRVKMPIRVMDIPERKQGLCEWLLNKLFGRNPFVLEEHLQLEEPSYFTAAFSRDRMEQFLIPANRDQFFTTNQRIRMVWDLILRTIINVNEKGFPDEDGQPVGMKWFLREGVYVAAYPLHDGDYSDQSWNAVSPNLWPLRRWLFETWSQGRRWFYHQPLNQIRNYYGEKVAIYFAWLGFYTKMLCLPAVIGTLCFIFGLGHQVVDVPRKDICDTANIFNMTICRLCSRKVCPFKLLGDSCLFATLTYTFDNSATVFFALFTSIWAVVFLELWKRYQAELAWEWDVRDLEFEEDNVRPEYQAVVKTKRINPVTQEEEPYLPTRNKIQRLVASGATVLFMVFVVLSLLAGIITYRIFALGLYYKLKNPFLQRLSPLLTSISASAINAVCILIFEKIYERLAHWLTIKEFPRTENQFENSYTYKVFTFEFINYYAALFYIAFIKGKITGPPSSSWYVDRCDPAGCLIEVCIQLAIVMIVKQCLNNLMELGWPMLQNWWNRVDNVAETEDNKYTRWEKDFDLNPLPTLGLFSEYLEMIIQYGFVTMFVAAFPLAPLFALLNNVIEIRLDAYKLTAQSRRPVPVRAQDIGAWFSILGIITKTAVITNGLVIAFTSDFIDRMVYMVVYSADGTLHGYIQNVFSQFNTSGWSNAELVEDTRLGNVSFCYFRDYRELAQNDAFEEEYTRTRKWWHVLVARLVFVLIFEHVVFMIQGLIQYLIPDVPEHVQMKVQRENYLAKQALYKHEFQDDRSIRSTDSAAQKAMQRNQLLAAQSSRDISESSDSQASSATAKHPADEVL